ncbi:MAG: cryptochrome/photolyase family protein [Alphaproteobacteria bacterium]|nr:cryptochrome/photolyase family protein [Alphaproteobacteria bacterium]
MKTLRFIFWDQLSPSISSLKNILPSDIVLMCELREEVTRIPHHPKKIALWFSAMRHFAEALKQKGIHVRYIEFNDPLNTHNLSGEVNRAVLDFSIEKIIVTEPGEYHFLETIKSWKKSLNVDVEILKDDRFLCSIEEFKAWACSKKELRMEYFYRNMRKKYNILMEPDGSPTGGLWNYDKENRKPPSAHIAPVKRISHKKSDILKNVLELVHQHFGHHFGDLEPFHYAITRDQALIELDHFIDTILPHFGDYQDAMLRGDAYLYHSLLSSYINIGLLLPLEICEKADAAYKKGEVSINSAEGFIRQILGWREFIRGIYWLKMPEYEHLNALDAKIPLPDFYWGAKTHMMCVAEAVAHTKVHAYSHHIQRLMVTGNFALLTGLDVKEVHEWYLAVYSDAYEWVEMPNTLGMALFADGGIVASKPYAASGQYINKMSNFCKQCYYDVKEMTGPRACPFNALYWNFLYKHREEFATIPRLSFMYATWEKFPSSKKNAIISKASDILNAMNDGKL